MNARGVVLAAAAAFMLAVSVVLGWGMIRASAPTYDEPVHLMSGYLALRGRTPPNYRDHPPLGELWSALPLLALKPSTMLHHPSWGRLYNFADAFLYRNTVDAERLLDSARLWSLVSWTALFAAGLLPWAYRLAGAPGAAAAAALAAFCPALFSNAALVATDAPAAAFFLLTLFALSGAPRGPWRWAAAGLFAGAALASKFSMIALPPLALAAWLTDCRLRGERPSAGGPLLAAFVAAGAVLLVYRFEPVLFWQGLSETLTRLDGGRPSFLLERHGTDGWLWYFPAAVLVKTPLPVLLAAALGLALWLRRPGREQVWLLLPAAGYFAAACLSKTQIGYRHVLPVYPFLILAGACGAAWLWRRSRWGRAACLAGAAWLALGAARAHPDHLVYFNELAGGPAGGLRWLADSNLDWGQGLKPLAHELRRRGNPPVYLSYFGVADPSYYGIRYAPLGFITNVDRRDGAAAPGSGEPRWLAISATNLQGVYFVDKQAWAWLRERTPLFTAGRSIFVYDLSDDEEGRARVVQYRR